MKKSYSFRIYVSLLIILTILTFVYVFLPQGAYLPMQELPASKPVIAVVSAAAVLIIYGGLGYIGIMLSRKLGFADIWDPEVSNRDRFFIPFLIGIGIGIFLIFADKVFSRLHVLEPIPHPTFPASLVASTTAGIGEELIFRLFFISFWVWIISCVILKKKGLNPVFWIVTVFSALAFAAGHIPSVMMLYGLDTVNEIPSALITEIMFLNGLVSFFAAYYFRKYGFLAAVGIHFWTDIVWHVIWGAL